MIQIEQLRPFFIPAGVGLGALITGLLSMWLIWRSKYRNHLKDWEVQHNEHLREQNVYRSRITDLERFLNESESQNQVLVQDIASSRAVLQEKESEIITLTGEKEADRLRMVELETFNSELLPFRKMYSDLLSLHETAKQQLKDLQAKVGHLESQKFELNELLTSLRPYRTKFETLLVQYKEVERQMEAIHKAEVELRNRLNKSKEEDKAPSFDLIIKDQEIEELRNTNQALIEQYRQAETKRTTLEAEIAMLAAELQAQKEIPPTIVKEDSGELKDLQEKVTELDKETEAQKVQNLELQGRLRWAFQEREFLKVQVKELRSGLEKQNQAAEESKTLLAQREQELSKLRDTFNRLKAQFQDLG